MKQLHQSVLTVIAASLLSSTPVWASAQEAVTVQPTPAAEQKMNSEVELTLDRLYKLVPEIKQLRLESENYRPANERQQAAWFFHFTSRPDESEPGDNTVYADAFVEIAAETGDLLHFNLQYPDWSSEQIPTKELAKEKAKAFMQQILGDSLEDYQLSERILYGQSATQDAEGKRTVWTHVGVQFERLINGIPLLGHGYQVEVDSFGHVTSVYRVGEETDPAVLESEAFPDPAQAISRQEAEEAYRKLLNLELAYKAYHPVEAQMFGQSGETKPILEYVPRMDGVLDAVTGKEADLGWRRTTKQQSEIVRLKPAGRKLIAKSPEEAAKLLTAEFGFDMSNMDVDEREEKDSPTRNKYLHYSWHSKPALDGEGRRKADEHRFVHLGVDAATGQIFNITLQDDSTRGQQPKIDEKEAKEKAIALLEQFVDPSVKELALRYVHTSGEHHIPDWVDESKLDMGDYQQPPQVSFIFSEVHQGVPILDRSYAVSIDTVTGDVVGLTLSPKLEEEIAFPDSKTAVSAEEAANALLKEHPLRLVYIWPEFAGQRAPKPFLVYELYYTAGLGGYLDATTGKWVEADSGNR
ncbi:MAG: hypothetical protein H0Z34_11560 [Brevibacillus sp.]|nr:hypothetical protein [Brevibacillus sp.]